MPESPSVEDVLEALHHVIKRRRLLIWPVDGQGKITRWDDPAAVDIRIGPSGWRKLYVHYRLTALGVPEDSVDAVKTELMAIGRRHAMAGRL